MRLSELHAKFTMARLTALRQEQLTDDRMPTEGAMKQKAELLTGALHIFVLCNFAIAQPLLDLLSLNAEFFVVRNSELVDVMLLILILCILTPTFVVSVEVVVGLFGRRVRKGVHNFVITGLVAVISLPVLKQISGVTGSTLLVAGALLGVAAGIPRTVYV